MARKRGSSNRRVTATLCLALRAAVVFWKFKRRNNAALDAAMYFANRGAIVDERGSALLTNLSKVSSASTEIGGNNHAS